MSESNSVFSKQIESYAVHLARFFTRFIEGMSDDIKTNSKKFRDYLHNYSFLEDDFQRFINSLSMFESSDMSESLRILRESFPDIEMINAPKSQPNRIYFTDYLKDMDFKSPIMDASLRFFKSRCSTIYLTEILKNEKYLTPNNLKKLLKSLVKYMNFNNLSEFMVDFLMVVIDSWKRIFRTISKIIPDEIFDNSIEYFHVYRESPNLLNSGYLLFSKVVFSSESKLSTLITMARDDFVKSQMGTEFHNNCCLFLQNTISQYFEYEQNDLDQSFFVSLLDDSLKYTNDCKNKEEAFSFIALISNHTQNDFESAYAFVETFIDSRLDNSIIVENLIKSLIVKIKKEQLPYQYLQRFVLSNLQKLSSIEYQLSKLLFLLIKYDKARFFNYFIPELFDSPIFKEISLSLFRAFHYLLKNENISCYSEISKFSKQFIHSQTHKHNGMGCVVIYTTNSFTKALEGSVNSKSIALESMVSLLFESTYPIYTFSPPEDAASSKLVTWYSVSQSLIFEFVQEDIKQQTPQEIALVSVDKQMHYFLWYSIYLKPNDDIIRYFCSAILSNYPEAGALAMRSLQAMIHLHPEVGNQILNILYHFLSLGSLSYQAIVILIYATCLIFEAIQFEQVELTTKSIEYLQIALLIGYCIPMPCIRKCVNKVYQSFISFVSGYESLPFKIIKFENKHWKTTKKNALNAISLLEESEINLLPDITFNEVCLSNIPSLYLFYLSSLGKFIAENEKVFQCTEIISKTFSIASKISRSTSNESFLLNIYALIFPLSNIFFSQNNNKSHCLNQIICSIPNLLFSKDKKEHGHIDVILIGVLSNISSSLYEHVLLYFSQPIQFSQRILCFVINKIIESGNFNPLNENGTIKSYYYTLFHSTLIFLQKANIVGNSLNFNCSSDPQISMIIMDYCNILKTVFDMIYDKFKSNKSFLFVETFIKLPVDIPFSAQKWFILLCNLCNSDDCFTPILFQAFQSWLRIFPIPESYFSTFSSKIVILSKNYPDILIPFFGRYAEHLIVFFISKGIYEFQAYYAITEQISSQLLDANIVSDIIYLQDYPILSLMYRHCGSLISLSMYYLMSKKSSQRVIALRMLYSLGFLSGLVRKDVQSTVPILFDIDVLKKTILSSFSLFIQRDYLTFNEVIAKHFRFCSEQFVSESFEIIKAKLEKKKVPKKNDKAAKEICANNLKINNGKIFSIPIKNNTSKYKSLSRLKKNKSSFFESNKVKQVTFDKNLKIISLLSSWLNPLNIDLQRIGISPFCEPEFLQFGIYSFIDLILSVCSIDISISDSLISVLDIVVESSCDISTFCLLDFSLHKPQYHKVIMKFMIYLFHKNQSYIIEVIKNYLSVNAWFYYEALNNRDEQIFDTACIQEILEGGKQKIEHKYPNEISDKTQSDYYLALSFFLEFIGEINKESEDQVKQIYDIILMYCAINTTSLYNNCNNLITDITKIRKRSRASTHCKKTLLNRKELLKWKLEEIATFIKKYNHGNDSFLLKWGLCCGNLSMASRAMKLFSLSGFIISSDVLPVLYRSMEIVSKVLNERASISNTETQNNNWLLRIVSEDGLKTDGFMKYLSSCFQILDDFITKGCNIHTSVFWAAASALDFYSSDFSNVYSFSIDIIYKFVLNSELLGQLIMNIDPNFKGILSILLLKLNSSETINKVFIIIYNLFINEFFEIICQDKSCKCIIAFILIIYIKENTKIDIEKVMNVVSKHYIKSLKEIFIKLMNSNEQEIFNTFSKIFLDFIEPDKISSILSFYTQILQYGSSSQKICVYKTLISLLTNNIEYTSEISDLLFLSLNDKENERNDSRISFIQQSILKQYKVNQSFGTINKIQKTYPIIKVSAALSYSDWRPNVENVFEDYKNFPPMLLTDISLYGSEIVKQIKNKLENLDVVPFTNWSQTIFKAQLQSNNEIDTIGDRVVAVKIELNEFMNEIKKEFRKRNEIEENQVSENPVKHSESFHQIPLNDFLQPSPCSFMPSESYVSSFGQSILQEFLED